MELTIEHQARELLHVIGLVSLCLRLRNTGPTTRARWKWELIKAAEALEALYARGLPRDFLSAAGPPGGAAPAALGPRIPCPSGPETGLKPWQRTLLMRLEHSLGRTLDLGDRACIGWNFPAETMSVVARPLLGELRARNLTSNVFRGWPPRTAGRVADDPTSGRAGFPRN